MIHLTLHCHASPTEVLAALRAHGGEWRESQIPDDLRRAAIVGVDCETRNAGASLRYARMSRDLGPELIAAVTADPMGGTLLDVRVGYRPVPYVLFVIAVLFAAVGVWGFAGSPWVVLPPVLAAGFVAFNVMLVRESNAGLLSPEREPSYLIERLERALASAGVRRVVPPPANDR